MAAKWTWGSNAIFVSAQDISRESINALLTVLDGTSTTIQHLSGTSEKQEVAGLIIGEAVKDAILADAAAGTSRTFTSDQGGEGTFVIIGEPKIRRVHYSGALIDGVSYDGTTPLFKIAMEIMSTS